jgi:DNA (cytosine-5)-methyltransferase 1
MGYHEAGFDVVGVDIEPQPHYPFEFVQADATEVLSRWMWPHPFQAIHASPPCQAHTGVPNRREHPDLIPPTRAALEVTGLPWVMENVPGAEMGSAIMLCGATFGLPIIRHRLFESSFPMMAPSTCRARSTLRATSHGPGFYPFARKSWRPAWRQHVMPVIWPWMTLEETHQAIPPAYTEFIGSQLLEALKV